MLLVSGSTSHIALDAMVVVAARVIRWVGGERQRTGARWDAAGKY